MQYKPPRSKLNEPIFDNKLKSVLSDWCNTHCVCFVCIAGLINRCVAHVFKTHGRVIACELIPMGIRSVVCKMPYD